MVFSFLRRLKSESPAEIDALAARLQAVLPPTSALRTDTGGDGNPDVAVSFVASLDTHRARLGAILSAAVDVLREADVAWRLELDTAEHEGPTSRFTIVRARAQQADELIRAHDQLMRLIPDATIEMDLEVTGTWIRRIPAAEADIVARRLVTWWQDSAWPSIRIGGTVHLSMDVGTEGQHPDYIYEISSRAQLGSMASRWTQYLPHLQAVMATPAPGSGINLIIGDDGIRVSVWNQQTGQADDAVADEIVDAVRQFDPQAPVRRY